MIPNHYQDKRPRVRFWFNHSSQLANPIIVPRAQAPRPRDESAEEKRRRKRAVKVERQARRVEKKEKKEQFSAALKQQSQALSRKGAQVTQL